MNLGLLLKMLGVKIAPEQIAQIEALLPQLPGKLQEIIGVVNSSLQNVDHRLRAIEAQIMLLNTAITAQNEFLIKLVEVQNGGRPYGDNDGDARPAGIGATERANGRGDS
jgi:hypothetical protein